MKQDVGNCPIKKVVSKKVIKHRTNCPLKIAEYEGIKVIELEPLAPADSYFYIKNNKKYIAINKKYNGEKYNYLLAHELGHIIYHKDKFSHFFNSRCSTIKGKKDCEADIFAQYLLDENSLLFF